MRLFAEVTRLASCRALPHFVAGAGRLQHLRQELAEPVGFGALEKPFG
jgi:hypothetical protein